MHREVIGYCWSSEHIWPHLLVNKHSVRASVWPRSPHHCGGCWEWIGAAGAVKQCRYDSKFHYYRRGTRIMTVLPDIGHPFVGQIEEDPDAVDPNYRT